jgi:hypothetical protein
MKPKPILKDRRFLVAVISVAALFVLGWRGLNTSDSIALVAISLAGANAASEAAMAFARNPKKKTNASNKKEATK